MNPEAHEIVRIWLEENDYDGLYREDCGCAVSGLMPCDEYNSDCMAGYKKVFKEGEDCGCGEGCPWHIQKGEPEDRVACKNCLSYPHCMAKGAVCNDFVRRN